MVEHKSLEVSPVKEGVVAVDEWQEKDEDKVIKYAGKSIIIPFDQLLDRCTSDLLNVFYVSYKDSYSKKFDQITHYLNYFIKYYDPDNELIMNYFHCKFMIDAKRTIMTRKAMIKLIYHDFVTNSIYNKIKKMVEDNYRIDLSQNKEAGKEYSESLEFTNKHAKLLMIISIFIKMLIPLVMHYISVIKGKSEVKKLILYYRPLFEIIRKKEHVNLYAKLQHSIQVKVNFNESNNPVIWAKYQATSIDAVSYAEELLDKNLIVDNMFKYVFNKSIISFNSVILKTQLEYRCIKNFGITMQEISDEKDQDGLSYLDKLEMDTAKIDENNILLSKVNIKDTIKRIKKKNKIKITNEEREFYIKNTKISKIAKTLVFYYYAKTFNGFTDLNHITIKKYMDLMIILKRKLQVSGFIYINQIISANVLGKSNSHLVYNSNRFEKLENNPIYKNIENEKYPSLKRVDDDVDKKKKNKSFILGPLQTIENTMFGFVDYDEPSKLNKVISFDYDVLAQEYEDFINLI